MSGPLMRLFVAVHLPDEVRGRLALIQDRLRRAQADVSWVKPTNLHLTLKFLGDTEPKRLDGIQAALAEAAAKVPPFCARIAGVGTFGGRVPRVVWAGVAGGAEPLGAVGRAVEDGLARLGFPKETRGFAAHLTLGRVRSPRNVGSLLAALGDESRDDVGMVPVERFALMQSELNPSGSIYTELAWFSLGTTAGGAMWEETGCESAS